MYKLVSYYNSYRAKYFDQFSRVMNKLKNEVLKITDQIPEKVLKDSFERDKALSCSVWKQKNGNFNYFLGISRNKLNCSENYRDVIEEVKELFKDNYPGISLVESYDVALISNAFVFKVIKDDLGELSEEEVQKSIVKFILDISAIDDFYLDENITIDDFDIGDILLTTKLD